MIIKNHLFNDNDLFFKLMTIKYLLKENPSKMLHYEIFLIVKIHVIQIIKLFKKCNTVYEWQ